MLHSWYFWWSGDDDTKVWDTAYSTRITAPQTPGAFFIAPNETLFVLHVTYLLQKKKESNRVCVRRKGRLYDNDLSLLIQFRHKHKTLSPQFAILPYHTANNQIFSRKKKQ